MQLVEQDRGGQLFVRRCAADRIVVVDREFTASFVLALDRVLDPWPVASAGTLGAGEAAPLLALDPEVVLLGTGARQVFPPAAFLAAFLTRGIGIEPMDNAAAARTFNVLGAEGRRVVAAFILPGG
ncbi:MAG: Mth938-like domain-containing protein [Xanthomonadaceae bacterium]|jgi:uncharacterized protein|nr:Mth938-like domain-containing protein [Xanthomonadaceae bacterium]